MPSKSIDRRTAGSLNNCQVSMRSACFLLFISLALVAFGCARSSSKPRMTQEDVVRVARAAMIARFPDAVAAHEPYHAEFRDGSWSVSGTVPAGMRGGGAPEAVVRDADETVTEVNLSR